MGTHVLCKRSVQTAGIAYRRHHKVGKHIFFKCERGTSTGAVAAEKTATPAPQDGQVVEVTLRLTEGTLDSWWSKLPLNDKATIMGGNYDSKLDNIPLLGTVG